MVDYLPAGILAVCVVIAIWILLGFPGTGPGSGINFSKSIPITGETTQQSWGQSFPGAVINPTPEPEKVWLSSESDPYWTGNYSNLINFTCPAGNYSYGINENGTVLCRNDFLGVAAEADPYWTGNYSLLLTPCPAGEYAYGIDSSGWRCFNDSVGLTSETDPRWSGNYTNLIAPCAPGQYVEGMYANGSFICRVLPSSPGETDPFWAGNYTNLISPCGANHYVEGVYANGSLMCQLLPVAIESDPYWFGNYTNLLSPCGAGEYVQGIYGNGTLMCGFLPALVESDPYWTANYTNMLVGCQANEYAWGINSDGSIKCKNLTVNSLEQNITVSVVGGSGVGYSAVILDYLIKQIIVYPATPGNTYHFSALENSTGAVIDRDRIQHTGVWNILKDFAVINSKVTANITGSVVDESFLVTIRYVVRE